MKVNEDNPYEKLGRIVLQKKQCLDKKDMKQFQILCEEEYKLVNHIAEFLKHHQEVEDND